MAPQSQRFEMRVDEEFLEKVDNWRSKQSDVPSRAEAVRRLAEAAMAVGVSDPNVKFSDGEKTIMLMLRDVYKGLKLKGGETDFDFIAHVIYGGHYWAPKWVQTGLHHEHQDSYANVKFTVDVLDMWYFIEEAATKMTAKDKKRFELACPHSYLEFPGFDGNNETEHLGIARFLIEEMNRFEKFKGRSLNAHHPTLGRYRRMVQTFLPIRKRLDHRNGLSVDELVSIFSLD